MMERGRAFSESLNYVTFSDAKPRYLGKHVGDKPCIVTRSDKVIKVLSKDRTMRAKEGRCPVWWVIPNSLGSELNNGISIL